MSLLAKSSLRAAVLQTMKTHYPAKGHLMNIKVFPVDKKNDLFNRCCQDEEYHVHVDVGPYDAKTTKYVGIGALCVPLGLTAALAWMFIR